MKLRLALTLGTAMLASSAFSQELTVWDWKSGDPVTQGYYESAKAAFEAANPGASVKFVVQPHDQYYTLLGTALETSEGPDVVLVHGGSQTQSRSDVLTDVGMLAEGFAGQDVFSKDGTSYAIPLTIQGFVVYYNKKLYEAAGLDASSGPATWNELSDVCKAIIEKGDVPCFAMGNKQGFGGEFFVTLATANSFNEDDYKAWVDGELAWTDPKVRAVVDLFVEMNSQGWIQEGANSTAKFMDEYESFMRSEAAHTVGLLSDVAHWKQFGEFLGDENLGAFPFPTPDTDKALLPFAGGIGWAVTATTKQPELAKSLVSILSDGERQAIFALDTGALPANPGVDTSQLKSPTLAAILSVMQDSPAGMPHALLNPVVLEEWKRQSQLLISGETTADAAVDAMEVVRKAN